LVFGVVVKLIVDNSLKFQSVIFEGYRNYNVGFSPSRLGSQVSNGKKKKLLNSENSKPSVTSDTKLVDPILVVNPNPKPTPNKSQIFPQNVTSKCDRRP
jgi:hypothetical protein